MRKILIAIEYIMKVYKCRRFLMSLVNVRVNFEGKLKVQ